MLSTCVNLRRTVSRLGRPRKVRETRSNHTYTEAIETLNSLQSNFSIVNEIRRNRDALNKAAIPEMLEWLQQVGYHQSDFKRLNIIHVAGTKGKGSTATFISSILNQYRRSGLLHKVGLYTSPHLRFVRERIQIDGHMISEDAFAAAFFELWQRFNVAASRNGRPPDASTKPVYFRYLTLMAFHIFLQKGVDTAVIECGIGGEYDSTNIIPSPTVAAITALGFDHVEILGKEISEIAWHKGGIIKPNAPVFTVPQLPEALAKLQDRATKNNVQLQVVGEHPQLQGPNIKLRLEGSFQRMNASLAIAVAAEHLRQLGHSGIRTDFLPPEFVRGLQEAYIGGRCETLREPYIAWHLDGAHTLESIRLSTRWFTDSVQSGHHSAADLNQWPRILIFNQQTRDAVALLREVHRSLTIDHPIPVQFSHVIFCSNKTFERTGYSANLMSVNTNSKAVDSLEVQNALLKAWNDDLKAPGSAKVLGSIEEAIRFARKVVNEARGNRLAKSKGEASVLIIGSVHLVGGALEILETQQATPL